MSIFEDSKKKIPYLLQCIEFNLIRPADYIYFPIFPYFKNSQLYLGFQVIVVVLAYSYLYSKLNNKPHFM